MVVSVPVSSVAANHDAALDLLLDPITGPLAHGKKVKGGVMLYVDDCVLTGTYIFHKLVTNHVNHMHEEFVAGSIDVDDIMFIGQRTRWVDEGKEDGRCHARPGSVRQCYAQTFAH
eukprot:11887084-Prorocentrum_lima.AAC.1